MPGNGICRDPGFKISSCERGTAPLRAPPLGIHEPTAESFRKAVENTDIYVCVCVCMCVYVCVLL